MREIKVDLPTDLDAEIADIASDRNCRKEEVAEELVAEWLEGKREPTVIG
ncbi:MAG: hypothetical protein ABEK59_08085 [Halobacteria archaeon]